MTYAALIAAVGKRKTGGGSPALFDASEFDANSLINSRMWTGEYKAHSYDPAFGPTITLFSDPTDGDCALVNALANSPDYGTTYTAFVCPPGCTSVKLRLRIKLPIGAVANSINFGMYNPSFGGYVDSISITVTPTGTLTTHEVTYPTLTPGERYYVVFNFNYPSQAPCLVKSVEAIPLSGTGLFSGDFYRLACEGRTAIYDGQPEVFYPAINSENTHFSSSNTRFPVLTDATEFALEYVRTSSDATFTSYLVPGYYVDGVAQQLATAGSVGKIVGTFSLSAGTKRVEPYTSVLWKGNVPGDGCFPRALYIGTCTALSLPGELSPAALKFLVIGDSVTSGCFADHGKSAWAQITNAGTYKGVLRACAGQSFADTCLTEPMRASYVAKFANNTFDHLYVAVEANDAVSNTFSGVVADFKAALADFVAKFHAAFPTKRIVIQSGLVWRTSDATQDPWRTAMQEVATDNPTFCDFIDGKTLINVSDLKTGDDYHPDQPGTNNLKTNIVAALTALGY